ncbi:MAG: hypothetical protein JXR30_02255 [Alphaproteobacteria bacterium]|nr:hypothetical protein [Alphaproteobacteria bacterium]
MYELIFLLSGGVFSVLALIVYTSQSDTESSDYTSSSSKIINLKKREILGTNLGSFIADEHRKNLKYISLDGDSKKVHLSREIENRYEDLRERKKLPFNKQPFSWLDSQGVFLEKMLRLNDEALYLNKSGKFFTGKRGQKITNYEEVQGENSRLVFHLPYSRLPQFTSAEEFEHGDTSFVSLVYDRSSVFDKVYHKPGRKNKKQNLSPSLYQRRNDLFFLLNMFIKSPQR